MGVLAWLGVPAGATILAIFWVNWMARPRGPVAVHESIAERERFKAALSAPPAQPRRAARSGAGQTADSAAERRAS